MKIALGLGPEPCAVAAFGAQCGVKHAVGDFSLDPKPGLDIGDPEQPFSQQTLARRKTQPVDLRVGTSTVEPDILVDMGEPAAESTDGPLQ